MDKVVGVSEALGKSMLEFLSREEDSKFLALLLDTSDQKCLVEEQLKMHLASERAKHHQHEQLPMRHRFIKREFSSQQRQKGDWGKATEEAAH
jgi:hypothetical protein